MKEYEGQQLVALKKYYLRQLPIKITAIESAWKEILLNPNSDYKRVLYRQLHDVNGSAGTYGYKEISAIARKLDKFLRANQDYSIHQARIDDLIAKLREISEKLK